jgi:uncharacterized membrane protein YhdT
VIHIALVLLLWLLSPSLYRAMAGLSARWQERACFALPVVSHLMAWLLVLLVIVPQYIHNETNFFKERVGIVCVSAALLVAVRYTYTLTRALLLIQSSQLQSEAIASSSATDVPIWITSSEYPLLAVTGFLAPKIVASRALLKSGVLSSEALKIVLAHERAHLNQFDNCKLLILSSLDLPLWSSCAVRRWRRAAEIAADDDAVDGCPQRAILLAETLLAAARAVPPLPQANFTLGLLPHEDDLEDRIHRLLGEETASGAHAKPVCLLGATLLLCGAATLLITLAPIHKWTEYLLHLG